LRNDSHHTKSLVRDWLETHEVDFTTGLQINARLKEQFADALEQARTKHKRTGRDARVFASGGYPTRSGRGAMELMIKDHKNGLCPDRISCRKFTANRFRLFLHSAAYVLMHYIRSVRLKGTQLAYAQFDTIRLRLLKIGTRVESGPAGHGYGCIFPDVLPPSRRLPAPHGSTRVGCPTCELIRR